jgi:hypothetical protein
MNQQRTDKTVLTEEAILKNEQLVEAIKDSEQSLSKPVSVDDFMQWLDQ